jgi:hypothetical protein
VARRTPAQARALGLWTAAWLALFLLVLVLRVGDLSVEWPVFAVPALWAAVALRPRHRAGADRGERADRDDRGDRGDRGVRRAPDG